MPTVTINDNTPLHQYVATASQTDFVFSFYIEETSNIKVYINDVLKTETTDYAVKQSDGSSIADDDLPLEGGKVVLVVGATLNDKITITREIATERLSAYTTSGKFNSKTLNEEFNRLIAIFQRQKLLLSRSIIKSDSDSTGGNVELPTDRANKYLAFDASSNMIAAEQPTDGNVVSTFMATVLDDTTASDALTTLGLSAYAKTLIDDANPSSARNTLLIPNKNSIVNSDFSVAQRGTTFDSTTTPANNDDTYVLDRWVLLSDGNDACDVSQESSVVPTGSRNAIKLEAETADKQFGICQIIEASEVDQYVGSNASLSFKARTTSSGISNIRASVLAWDGTADAVSSDVVSTWAATPTFATNWTSENTPSDLSLTDSYQTFTVENIAIDTSNTVNLAVFIWVSDTTITAGDLLYLSDVKLERSSVATEYESKTFSQELIDCQRRFCKSYSYNKIPGSSSFLGSITGSAETSGGGGLISGVRFPVRMASAPTVTIYHPSTGTVNSVYEDITAASKTVTGAANIGDLGVKQVSAATAILTSGSLYSYHYAADAEL